jgi:hypothetical protein
MDGTAAGERAVAAAPVLRLEPRAVLLGTDRFALCYSTGGAVACEVFRLVGTRAADIECFYAARPGSGGVSGRSEPARRAAQ